MNTTYTPFCSEIPFLRTLRRPMASAAAFWAALLPFLGAALLAVALPPFYWMQFLCLPFIPFCLVGFGLWGHARGNRPLKSAAFRWATILSALLLALTLLAAVALLAPLPYLHDLLTTFLTQIGLSQTLLQIAPLAVLGLLTLTLLVLLLFCKSACNSIRSGLARLRGGVFLGILLLLWATVLLLGGGLAAAFYTPQDYALPLALPFNFSLAASAVCLSVACILWAVVLFRMASIAKKFKKF